MTTNEQIGVKIRYLRNQTGLTQKAFGEMFNLSQNAITNIETGKRELLYDELIKIAEYFGVSTDFIIKKNAVKEYKPTIQYICDYTGLSPSIITTLNKLNKQVPASLWNSLESTMNCHFDYLHTQKSIDKQITDFKQFINDNNAENCASKERNQIEKIESEAEMKFAAIAGCLYVFNTALNKAVTKSYGFDELDKLENEFCEQLAKVESEKIIEGVKRAIRRNGGKNE